MTGAIGMTLAIACFAQPPSPAFEVVSVKPGGPATTPPIPGQKTMSRGRPLRISGQSLTATQTLKHLIQYAFSLEDWAEGPDWFNDEIYDIRATMAANT